MREIKFRAWDKDLKKMRTVSTLYFRSDGKYGPVFVRDGNEVGCKLTLEEFHLMQFTGIKDKNGKEVFEGDILKTEKGNACVEYHSKYSIGYRLKWKKGWWLIRNTMYTEK